MIEIPGSYCCTLLKTLFLSKSRISSLRALVKEASECSKTLYFFDSNRALGKSTFENNRTPGALFKEVWYVGIWLQRSCNLYTIGETFLTLDHNALLIYRLNVAIWVHYCMVWVQRACFAISANSVHIFLTSEAHHPLWVVPVLTHMWTMKLQ